MKEWKLRLGACYYPEQRPAARWPEDVRLMREAGFNVVRLAEYSWGKLEMREGQYDFAWLDEAIALLWEAGIGVILGTPTASPPPWLTLEYPSVLPVDESGLVRRPGSRRGYCPNSQVYRDLCSRIVNAMAEHYRGAPAVLGWQIDNEFGMHNSLRCYCVTCAGRFRDWLCEKYKGLDQLNEAWGTNFWGSIYTAWEQVPLPWKSPGRHNPSCVLDYYRFASDSFVFFQQVQLDILRETAPHQLVTHNMVPLPYDNLNYRDLARNLDLAAWDNYDVPEVSTPALTAFSHDFIWGIRRQNYWILEQQCRQDSTRPYNPLLPPGEMRLRTYQNVAHGADAVFYFPWQSSPSGCEEYEAGLLSHAGETTRAYDEARTIGHEFRRLGRVLEGTAPSARIAMLMDYENIWALQLPPHNADLMGMEGMRRYFTDYYEVLHDLNIPVAILDPEVDLLSYPLVIAPSLMLMKQSIASNLSHYVESGGTLLLTIRSGVKNWSNLVTDVPLPGLLRALVGARVADFDCLPPSRSYSIALAHEELPAGEYPAKLWCEIMEPESATVLGRYVTGPWAGKAAVTANSYGSGRVVYIGAVAPGALYRAVLGWLLSKVGVKPVLATPPGVEAVRRVGPQADVLFLLNHNESPQTVTLGRSYVDALTGENSKGSCTLGPRAVRVLLRPSV